MLWGVKKCWEDINDVEEISEGCCYERLMDMFCVGYEFCVVSVWVEVFLVV